MTALSLHPVLAGFGGAIEFIFHKQVSNVTGGHKVGGFHQVLELALKQIEVSAVALALAIVSRAARKRSCTSSALFAKYSRFCSASCAARPVDTRYSPPPAGRSRCASSSTGFTR